MKRFILRNLVEKIKQCITTDRNFFINWFCHVQIWKYNHKMMLSSWLLLFLKWYISVSDFFFAGGKQALIE